MPSLVTLLNNAADFQYYYGGKGHFSQGPDIPKTKYTTFDDGLVRGGVANSVLATTRDVVRIGKFLKSSHGVSFITKQIGLQLTNPQLEQPSTKNILPTSGQGLTKNIANTITNLAPTRTYNSGLNTLTQIGVEAAGLHIVRHGLLPKFESEYNYESVVKNNDKLGNNRLVNYLTKIQTVSDGPITLDSYIGGPNSTYGIGFTNIVTTTSFTNHTSSTQFPNIKSYAAIAALSQRATDDRKNNSDHLIGPNTPNYNVESIEKRLGISKGPNSLNKQRTVDSINVINILNSDVFYNASKKANTSNASADIKPYLDTTESVDGYFGRDIIKFRIETLNNDTPINNGSANTEVLAFRAYINEFNDNIDAKWNTYRYMGRGEEFYVYDSFTRDINLSFTVYAHSPEEMGPIYNKLNYLISTLTPDYSSTGKMRGNISYITVGDYLYRQPGIITNIHLSGFLDTHWEIAMSQPEENAVDKAQYEVPKMLRVILGFKPIGTYLPRRNTINKYTAPFITPDVKAYDRGNNKYLPIK
jgi:hypothetical protein